MATTLQTESNQFSLEIKNIVHCSSSSLAWHLDAPAITLPSVTHRTTYLEISGWVHATGTVAHYVVAYSNLCYRNPLIVSTLYQRPDVNVALDLSEETKAGFRFQLNLIGLQDHSTIYIAVILDTDLCGYTQDASFPAANFQSLARIDLVVSPPSITTAQNGPAPCFVTSLGRSGTTALMAALSHSPAIYTTTNYPYENRRLSYYIHLAHLSVTPSAPYLPIAGENFLDVPFLASTNPFIDPIQYPNEFQFYDQNSIRLIRQMLRTVLTTLIPAHIERTTGDPHAAFLAEKLVPGTLVPAVAELVWGNSKEVILVREFDDWLRSAIAFSQNTGLYWTSSVEIERLLPRITADVEGLCRYVESRKGKALIIKYEDLVAGNGLQKVCEFLHIDITGEMISALKSPPIGHVTSGSSPSAAPPQPAQLQALRSTYNSIFGYV